MEPALEKIFEEIENIPQFPKVVQKALEILRKEDVDFRELEKIIKSDPGITANFLKLVNSPVFELPQKVDSLLRAFMLLGIDQIRFILLSCVAKNYFEKDLKGYKLKAQEIWLHSITSGIIAEEIALYIGLARDEIESLYIASILHDIGKIILELFISSKIKGLQKLTEKDIKEDFSEIEWRFLGIDHALAGAYLLERWNFSKDIVFAIRVHHQPDLMTETQLASIVALSNVLATTIAIGGGIDAFNYKVSNHLLKTLNIKKENVEKILKKAFIKAILIKYEFL